MYYIRNCGNSLAKGMILSYFRSFTPHWMANIVSKAKPDYLLFFRNHQNSLQSFLMVNEYYHFERWQPNITYHFLLIYFHGGIITCTITFYKMINLRTKLNFIISLLFFCGQACLSSINV